MYRTACCVGGWRSMFAVAILLALLQAAGMSCMPESPRWLALKGRDTEALAVLTIVHGDQSQVSLRKHKVHAVSHRDSSQEFVHQHAPFSDNIRQSLCARRDSHLSANMAAP
jgi:MFS family permease